MPTQTQNSKPSARIVDITADNAGQRVDNFLLSQLKGVPKSHVYRLLRSGQVRVNSGRKKPSYRLAEGDAVRIPPVRVADAKPMNAPDSVIKLLIDSKLYEDDNLLIINKPSGIPVHSGSGYDFGVIEALRKPYENQFLELVHRIDRETSGCLVMAKNRVSLTRINALFSENKTTDLQKYYQALVQGHWPEHITTVSEPLLKIKRGGEHMVEVNTEGSHAISHFHCEHKYELASLMDVKIETGRTHQIRVHAAHTKHPIAGDSKYGQSKFNKTIKKMGLSRLFLHALRIDL
jgi:23S rRNA pseudouridine955/2504/2580 synthase